MGLSDVRWAGDGCGSGGAWLLAVMLGKFFLRKQDACWRHCDGVGRLDACLT
jgi:hypothetical protein